MEEQGRVTQLITELRNGDDSAQAELFDLLYDELHVMARQQRRRFEGSRQTLNTTALIHEVFLKFDRAGQLVPNDRTHFLLIASRAMRQLLIGYARERKRQKRGGEAPRVTFGPEAEREALIEQQGDQLLDIDRVLIKLEAMDQRLGKVTELLFFGGLTYDEAAEVLGIGRATVSRDWQIARAWLRKELQDSTESGSKSNA